MTARKVTRSTHAKDADTSKTMNTTETVEEPVEKSKSALDKISNPRNSFTYTLDKRDNYKIRDWIDTGNAALNALISGDPDRGVPSGRITELIGHSTSGKTFLARQIANNAQKIGYDVFWIETEFGSDDDYQVHNPKKWQVEAMNTVENIRNRMMQILDGLDPEDKLIFVLDSLGNTSTNKEIKDTLDGKDTTDMTRARMIKSLFRNITVPLGIKNVPFIVINHTYNTFDPYARQDIVGKGVGGGEGAKLMPSIILEFSRKRDKESSNGSLLKVRSLKNRFAKEDVSIDLAFSYKKGILPLSGLWELAQESGFVKSEKKGVRKAFNIGGELLLPDEIKPEHILSLRPNGLDEYIKDKYSLSSLEDRLDNEILFLTQEITDNPDVSLN